MRQINPDELFVRMAFRLREQYQGDPAKLDIAIDVLQVMNNLIYEMEIERDEEEL